jgi:hypothetical protein
MPANLTLRTLTPTLGTSKGSALTFAEMDNNLKNLDALLGIANVSVDTSPTLGGNLTVNGNYFLGLQNWNNSVTQAANAGVLGTTVFNSNTASGHVASEITFKTGGTLGSPTYTAGIGLGGPGFNLSGLGLTVFPGDAFFYSLGGNVKLVDLLTSGSTIGFSNGTGADLFKVNSSTGDASLLGNLTAKTGGFAIGYRDVPQVTAGNVTLALTDAGKHYLDTSLAPLTITIPTNANVAFEIGTVVSFINQSTGNLVITAPTGGNLWLAGNATSANRTVTTYGAATIMKVGTNNWFINGNGVS